MLATILGLLCVASDPPLPTADVAFFEQKIRPLLAKHCDECHSEKAPKLRGGLRLDSRAGWLRGGDSGEPAIAPGKPAESPLLKAVRHEDGLAMPPKKKLSSSEIADLTEWIRRGAPDPRGGETGEPKRADKSWWSLQPIVDRTPPPIPDAPSAWKSNPIDAFVFAKLREKGLAPNPPADARTLIRRLKYDLVGLPPTPEEVAEFAVAFERDADAAAAVLVDRLLASPQYGERWGRHWLDVVRFGESNGFERNFIIDDLWPFRDYVIRSFNDDKPFDRFIVEHLAGDQVGKDRPEIEVGTAFLVAGPYDDVGNQDAVAAANIRAATLDDVITATGSAFLGLTVNCARCHHHKFDPIPTEDYYRLRAAFEGVTHGRRELVAKDERTARAAATAAFGRDLAALQAERAKLDAEIVARARASWAKDKPPRPKVDPQRTEDKFAPTAAKFVRFVIRADTSNPNNDPGPRGSGRLTEFEAWTAGPQPRNVALAANGAKASGAQSLRADDFPAAYGPQLAIDGKFGEQWFIGNPAVLTVEFAHRETIDRIAFSNAKGKNVVDAAQGATPCEYEVESSLDGKLWKKVASGDDRAPWKPDFGVARVRRRIETAAERTRLANLDRRIGEVQGKLAAVPPLRQVWAGTFAPFKDRTFVHKGGDPTKPGEPVLPSSLAVLASTKPFALPADAGEGARRLALANWIVQPDNPLTWRVLANRVWHYHFGVGIVDTPSDFGFLGGRPTHPELLDWLARRIAHHGYKLKPLHREIVLSQTYRQSSARRDSAAKIDGEARYLWRFPPRRLEAEEMRDTMLAVAGKLDLRIGGPGFRLYRVMENNVSTYFPLDKHGPETYRRAVYHQNVRASVVDLLSDFDLPDTAFSAPRRSHTTTPMQSLALLNHAFTLDMAAALADRVAREAGADRAKRIDRLYSLALQRPPTERERTAAQTFVKLYGMPAFARAAFNLNELAFLD